MDLELKIKSIEIDIETMLKIYDIDGSCDVEHFQKMKKNALKIREMLSEIEVPALTRTSISDKIIFKKLLFNILNDNRFFLKKKENHVYLLFEYIKQLLKCKNIDKKEFYKFLRSENLITTKKNNFACRVGDKVYSTIRLNIEEINRLLGIEYRFELD